MDEAKAEAEEADHRAMRSAAEVKNAARELGELRQHLDEESAAKASLQRLLAKVRSASPCPGIAGMGEGEKGVQANNETAVWRSKYEQEGVSKLEESEDTRRKLTNKIQVSSTPHDLQLRNPSLKLPGSLLEGTDGER